MTNRERYKQAFSALHPSGRLSLEVEEMAHIQKKHKTNMAIAAAIACAVIIGIPLRRKNAGRCNGKRWRRIYLYL